MFWHIGPRKSKASIGHWKIPCSQKKMLRAITHKSPWNFWHLESFFTKNNPKQYGLGLSENRRHPIPGDYHQLPYEHCYFLGYPPLSDTQLLHICIAQSSGSTENKFLEEQHNKVSRCIKLAPLRKAPTKTPERLFKLLLHRQVLKEKYHEIASQGYEVPGNSPNLPIGVMVCYG